MKNKNKDFIREYAQRWREATAQVNPLLLEKRDDQFIFQHL